MVSWVHPGAGQLSPAEESRLDAWGALLCAARGGHVECMQDLYELRAVNDLVGMFTAAVDGCNLESMALVRRWAVDAGYNLGLDEAASCSGRAGWTAGLALLRQWGVRLDGALRAAATGGHLDTVAQLCEWGPPNDVLQQGLARAAKYNQAAVADLLCGAARLDLAEATALAIEHGAAECLEVLRERRADARPACR